jgi:hypothetical protein
VLPERARLESAPRPDPGTGVTPPWYELWRPFPWLDPLGPDPLRPFLAPPPGWPPVPFSLAYPKLTPQLPAEPPSLILPPLWPAPRRRDNPGPMPSRPGLVAKRIAEARWDGYKKTVIRS